MMPGEVGESTGLPQHYTTNPFGGDVKAPSRKSVSSEKTALLGDTIQLIPSQDDTLKSPFSVQKSEKEINREALVVKVDRLFERYFQANRAKLNVEVQSQFFQKIASHNEGNALAQLNAIVETALNSTQPGSLRSVIELMLTVMEKERTITPREIQMFRSDFLQICKLYKKGGSSIVKVLNNVETGTGFIYFVNRTIRNLSRFVGNIAKSAKLQDLTASLGFVCFLGAITNLKDMVHSAWLVAAPNRTTEQRVSSLIDVGLYGLAFIDDMAMGLGAIGHWMKANPKFAALSVVGLYFAVAAVTVALAKNIFDLYFYAQLYKDLDGEAIDYTQLRERWDERINNYGRVVGALVRICEPQFLTVFEELNTELEKNGFIYVPAAEKVQQAFEPEQIKLIRIALKGRVKSKIWETSIATVATAVDLAALAILAATPVTGGTAYVAAAGGLFLGTSIAWFGRKVLNNKARKEFKSKISDAVNGVALRVI